MQSQQAVATFRLAFPSVKKNPAVIFDFREG
jgi:hypothetical protein